MFLGAYVCGAGLREGCQAAPKSRRGGAECYISMTLISDNTEHLTSDCQALAPSEAAHSRALAMNLDS